MKNNLLLEEFDLTTLEGKPLFLLLKFIPPPFRGLSNGLPEKLWGAWVNRALSLWAGALGGALSTMSSEITSAVMSSFTGPCTTLLIASTLTSSEKTSQQEGSSSGSPMSLHAVLFPFGGLKERPGAGEHTGKTRVGDTCETEGALPSACAASPQKALLTACASVTTNCPLLLMRRCRCSMLALHIVGLFVCFDRRPMFISVVSPLW